MFLKLIFLIIIIHNNNYHVNCEDDNTVTTNTPENNNNNNYTIEYDNFNYTTVNNEIENVTESYIHLITTDSYELENVTETHNSSEIIELTTEYFEMNETILYTTPLDETTTTTLDIFYKPILNFVLDLKVSCLNQSCINLICNNLTNLMTLESVLNEFICGKFIEDCNIEINFKKCNERSNEQVLIYDLNLRPKNKNEIDEIEANFYYYANLLNINSTIWNNEFNMLVIDTELNNQIDINFESAINSFNISYYKIKNSDKCSNLLNCENEYFQAVCPVNQAYICKHQCDIGKYCMNRGECVKGLYYEPHCKCTYSKINTWGLNTNYNGDKCQYEYHTIARNLFILIVTLVSSLLVLVIILAALKFHVFKKRSGTTTMIYA